MLVAFWCTHILATSVFVEGTYMAYYCITVHRVNHPARSLISCTFLAHHQWAGCTPKVPRSKCCCASGVRTSLPGLATNINQTKVFSLKAYHHIQHHQKYPTYLPTYLPTYPPTHIPTYPPTYLPTSQRRHNTITFRKSTKNMCVSLCYHWHPLCPPNGKELQSLCKVWLQNGWNQSELELLGCGRILATCTSNSWTIENPNTGKISL